MDLLLSLLVAAAAPPSPSPAPTPVASSSEYVEVTAKGLHDEVATVPAMVTVVGGDEIRARNASDLREVLRSVAGLDVAPGGDNGPSGSVPEFWGV
jgi:outer membrane receptor for ferrienterochelin and colicin